MVDHGPPFACSASLEEKTTCRLTEDVEHDTQGTSLWAASLRMRMLGRAWVKVACNLGRDHCAWAASVRDVVNSIDDAGSTRQGE